MDDTCFGAKQALETVALCDPLCFHTSEKEVIDAERLFSRCDVPATSTFLSDFKKTYFERLEEYRKGGLSDKYLSRRRDELRDYLSAVGETTYFLTVSELLKLVPLRFKLGVRDLLLENSCCDHAKQEVNAAVPAYLLLASRLMTWMPQ
jgi:hypothetical protein